MKFFENDDYEEYRELMKDWYKKFIVDKRSYLSKIAMKNIDMGLFSERHSENYKHFLELFFKDADMSAFKDIVIEIKKKIRDLPSEVGLIVMAVIHTEMAMVVKGMLTIVETQVLNKMAEIEKLGKAMGDNN